MRFWAHLGLATNLEWELDLDLDSHEVQPQYQAHAHLVPRHLNLKNETIYHHKKEMATCLLHAKNIPPSLWEEVVNYASYI